MCVFCETVNNGSKIIFQNDSAFAIYDGFPVSKGHTLIIPKRHVASFFELRPKEMKELYLLIAEMRKKLEETLHPDGFNVGINDGTAAGQTIMHAHVHLIPRYKGDVKEPRGGIRGVIPGKQSY